MGVEEIVFGEKNVNHRQRRRIIFSPVLFSVLPPSDHDKLLIADWRHRVRDKRREQQYDQMCRNFATFV